MVRVCVAYAYISIHAPLAGSDWDAAGALRREGISIHAPLAGSDVGIGMYTLGTPSFQSTLPLRGATRGSFVPSAYR